MIRPQERVGEYGLGPPGAAGERAWSVDRSIAVHMPFDVARIAKIVPLGKENKGTAVLIAGLLAEGALACVGITAPSQVPAVNGIRNRCHTLLLV